MPVKVSAVEAAFDIHDYSGKWVVLNYWARWCRPCVLEIEELNALQKEHASFITVLGVNYDNAKEQALDDDILEMGIHFKQLGSDPGPYLGLPRPKQLPTTFLFSPEGLLVDALFGPQTRDTIIQRIELNPK